MEPAVFVEHLAGEVPGVSAVVQEHLVDQGELLLHLLLGDLARFAEDRRRAGEGATVAKLLQLLDEALRAGREEVSNAVAVSFVEWHQPHDEYADFVSTWPEALQAEWRWQWDWKA